MDKKTHEINIQAVIETLDDILSRNDYKAACDFLESSIVEARNINDIKALFTLYNECIGIYRKIGEKEKCYFYCNKALEATEGLKLSDSVSGATTFINCATAYKAFSEAEKGISFFEKAKRIYEEKLTKNDKRLAGLYNNFALSLTDLKRFDEAIALYEKAISVLKSYEEEQPETAISYLNMANTVEAKEGLENACEKIDSILDKATEILDKTKVKNDGNYAFVCEKCASTFGYYGRFFYEAELKERAREIYERS